MIEEAIDDGGTPLVDALEERGGVELRLFLQGSRFAEVCWNIRVQGAQVHAHADRYETPPIGEARESSPLDLVLERTEAESHLLGLLEVDVHVRSLDQPADNPGVLDRCSFVCAKSGLAAGTVTLHAPRAPGHRHRVALSGFRPTGDVEQRLEGIALSQLRAVMFCRDARALWSYSSELLPFYCPECNACYAANEWQLHHNSATSVDGVCPASHRRRLCAD